MKPVTLINCLSIKLGMIDEFINAQRTFSATKPDGLVGGRMYRSLDGKTTILVSQFTSASAQEAISRTDAFKEHLNKLRPMVESSSPVFYEEAYTYGDFI